MKATTAPTEEAAAHATPHRWRRRGGRTNRPASAIIARGEPTLWLTAGALAAALVMIVGLIVLVVIMGGTTFWPARLVQVQLTDGRVLLGEVTATESYELSQRRAAALPDPDKAAALALLDGEPTTRVERTLLRVDNKQLTGEAFVWISEFQRVPGGTMRPEWAVTIERTSWGRFLGIPTSFSLQHDRPVSGVERQIVDLIAFLEEQSFALDEADRSAVTTGIELLRSELATLRATSTKSFLNQFEAGPDSPDSVAVLESGDVVPLSEAGPTRPVVAVRQRWTGAEAAWQKFVEFHPSARRRAAEIHHIDKSGLARLSDRIENARMATVAAGLHVEKPVAPIALRLAELDAVIEDLDARRDDRVQQLSAVSRRFGADAAIVTAVKTLTESLAEADSPQRASAEEELATLASELPAGARDAVATFRAVSADARAKRVAMTTDMATLSDENDRFVWLVSTADGIEQEIPVADVVRAFPANQLTVWERLGVYLSRWREFLMDEPREANTEGGVFPAIWGTVAMTLIMTLAVVPFGVLAALYLREYAKAGVAVSAVRIAVNNLAGVPSIVFGVFGLGFFCYAVGGGIDRAFYPEYVAENKPVFGTGGLLWASLTLALLTLPVVIVATEEALAAVPNSLREGSYACGASKWQTIRRIILPRALPGIMTGMILAMARGAGEVAPLMLVGAVKIAPDLPFDGQFPFIHPSRSFLHLGFHIYDLGFQSPDSEAAKPMVFTTTLLLITIVAVLNITAIWLRSRLRRRFAASQF